MNDSTASAHGTGRDGSVERRHDLDATADSDYVRTFIPLVEFLGAALGEHTEVVLHDVSCPDKSVIAIANGHISGRTVGSPATDLVMKTLKEGQHADRGYLIGYAARTARSDQSLTSSTYFIKREGRIVGSLCINTDQGAFHTLQRAVEQLGKAYFASAPEPDSQESHEENLVASVDDMAAQVIEAIREERRIPVARFGAEDRLEVIRRLDERGYFYFKGAVGKVARHLGVAESTAYRYLHMVQH